MTRIRIQYRELRSVQGFQITIMFMPKRQQHYQNSRVRKSINPVIWVNEGGHIRVKEDGIVVTTNGTCQNVKQIFQNVFFY